MQPDRLPTDKTVDAPKRDESIAASADETGALFKQTKSARPPSKSAGDARFTILHRHAEGGLGIVHLARDEQLQRTVALKEIRPERADQPLVRQRFLTEAEITGQLEHPGVVPIYALENDAAGRPIYAMRFIQGRTLREAIKKHHQQPNELGIRELLGRFNAVCLTMAYAHSKSVIHRDLKPANVMLGDYGETLVVDWGLAKRLGEETGIKERARREVAFVEPTATQTIDFTPAPAAGSQDLTTAGQVLGTPAYMAPEQARGEIAALGPAADVYALGAMLHEILTGEAPYRGQNAAEVLAQVRSGAPDCAPPPRTPKPLWAIRTRAMAREPGDRYESAKELARDVERWLADEAVSAHAEPVLARLGRWARRHRTAVTTGVALLFTITVAVTVSLVLLGAAKGETDKALKQVTEQEKETKKALDLVTIKEGETQSALTQVTIQKKAKELAFEQEREARKEAVKSFGLFVKDVQRELGVYPNMQAIRMRFLNEGRDGLLKIISKVGDPATKDQMFDEADFNLLFAYVHIGDINMQTASHEVAVEHYKKSLAIVDNGLRITPDSPGLLRMRALFRGRLGDIKLSVEHDNAATLVLYQQALADLEQAEMLVPAQAKFRVTDHHGTVSELLRVMRLVSNAIAAIYADQGKPSETMKQHTRSDAIQVKIEKGIADAGAVASAQDRMDRLKLKLLMASTSWQLGDPVKARRLYDEAVGGIEDLVVKEEQIAKGRKFSPDPRYANELAGGRGAFAEFLLRQRDYVNARKQGLEALAYAADRALDDRRNVGAQSYHAMCLFRLGVIEARDGKTAKAEEYYKQCLTIRVKLLEVDPDNRSRRLDLMMAQARTDNVVNAAKLANEMRPHADKKPYALIMIACGYACCIESLVGRKTPLTKEEQAAKERWTAAAMEALEAAEKLGYASPIAIETEEDLAGIFADPRFKALTARMRKNAGL